MRPTNWGKSGGRRLDYGHDHPSKPCKGCGRPHKLDNLEYGLCQRCLRVQKPHGGGKSRTVSVILDPSGDFRPGDKFDLLDFTTTLKAGNWEPGMVVRMHNGRINTVIGNLDGPYWLAREA